MKTKNKIGYLGTGFALGSGGTGVIINIWEALPIWLQVGVIIGAVLVAIGIVTGIVFLIKYIINWFNYKKIGRDRRGEL